MSLQIKKFAKGTAVVVQNSENRGFFYLVKSGLLQVDSEHSLSDKVLSRFEVGDTFGLVSAMTGYKFLVTVFAAVDSEVIEIPIGELGNYLKNKKELVMKMLRLYTKELKAVQNYLSKINSPELRQPSPQLLLNNAELYQSLELTDMAGYAISEYIRWYQQEFGKSAGESALQLQQKINSQVGKIVWQKNIQAFPAGKIIFIENEQSNDIYVIQSGSVRLIKLIHDKEMIIDVLGEGELFGEMAIIDSSPRMASAITASETVLMRLTKENLFESVGEVILQKIFESLARRIWFSHQRLEILRIPDPVARLYAFVYNLIRDKNIKSRNKKSEEIEYTFYVNFEQLKKMCGIMKIADEKIMSFLKDTNVVITENQITVAVPKRVEEKVAYYKTKSGQITSMVV